MLEPLMWQHYLTSEQDMAKLLADYASQVQKLEERIIELERKFDTAVRSAELIVSNNDKWYWEYG
tara:strand:+ start:170 stop:364 length:195 start_codon:yes stop_codon:yes gene_type:complete